MLDVRQITRPLFRGNATVVEAAAPESQVFAHLGHAGCCLTNSFYDVMLDSDVPVLVVDAEGFVIFINPESEALLGYKLAAITGKHIIELIDASATWIASEFSHLADSRLWNGSVLFKRYAGDNLRVAVNAFKSLTPSDSAEYIAFLHGGDPEGPAISRLPDVEAKAALSPGEIALLEMLSEGFVEKEIAAITGSPVWRIDTELQRLLDKLKVSSRTEACVRALQEGLLAV